MFKLLTIVSLAVACVSAKPGLLASPLVAAAPAVVTAHSSQVVARNYNGLAAPLVAAPVVASAPVVAAHAAPLLAAHSSPLVAAGVASPLAYSSPFLPYSSPLLPYSAYSAYAAAAPAVYLR